jgi:hypothetical protein
MDKHQAQEIIKETFESSFDKSRFTNFIKNLLNRIEESKAFHARGDVKEMFRHVIKTYERIGTYNSPEGEKIDIIITYLQKGYSLDHARVTQRNFAGRYLVDRGEKDAGIFAFVSPDQEDWRFSLVKMDYKFEQSKSGRVKVKEEFTPARRWSFLVGKNEKSHTAQTRLVNILKNDEQDPTLGEIEKAFDIETVTKEFFLEYRGLFLHTKDELDKVVTQASSLKDEFESKGVDTVNFAKKLLGQIVFLYFLQKKGWFGVGRDDDWGTGSKHFLRELFEKKVTQASLSACGNAQAGSVSKEKHKQDACDTSSLKEKDHKQDACDTINFFNDILEPLFYDALSRDRSDIDHWNDHFKCKIPFLNGGLFDPIGNYSWHNTDILLSNELFSNNVKTKKGDEGTGILDVFDRYNFTVKEDDPLEKEVAIDPELLGKAYEKFNAIRPDNYDEFKKALKSGKRGEENKFNKKFGVYYTPREIVHYMCRQSLINYLYTVTQASSLSKKNRKQDACVTITKEDIEALIHLGEHVSENEERVLSKGKETKTYSHQLPESIRNNAALIDSKLAEITVCDPAVGSGAFPVGMMSEIVKARNVLSVFPKPLTGFEPLSGLRTDTLRTAYDFKRHCIEHSLYGVDIDPGAVEIAKLRLWLSLVVDEDDIKNIKPLPNLDYRIMQGNSLISEFMGINFDSDKEKISGKLIFKDETDELTKQFQQKKDEFLNESNISRKSKLKKEVDNLMVEIFETKLKTQKKDYFNRLKEIENKHSNWPTEKQRNESMKQDKEKLYKETGFNLESVEKQLKEFTSGNKIKPFFLWNLYFSEVFHARGGFDMVIANPPYGANISENDKNYLKRRYEHIVERIRNSFLYFFGLAYNLIKNQGIVSYIIPNEFLFQIYMTKARTFFLQNSQFIYAFNIGEDVFEAIVPTCLVAIKKEIIDNYQIPVADFRNMTLKELDNCLQKGRFDTTNKNMVIDTVNSVFSFNLKNSKLVNRLIDSYQSFGEFCDTVSNGISTSCDNVYIVTKIFSKEMNFESLYLKSCIRGGQFKRYFCPSDTGDQLLYITKDFDPKKGINIFKYLKEHRSLLTKKCVEKNKGNRPWHVLFRARDEELFQVPKILFRQTGDSIIACIDHRVNYYGIDSVNIGILKNAFVEQKKYILGILNSKLITFIYRNVSQEGGRVLAQVKPQRIRVLPIAFPEKEKRKPLEKLVECILDITKEDDYIISSQKQAKVKSLEAEIDQLVYKLYDLTPEEIKILEGGN